MFLVRGSGVGTQALLSVATACQRAAYSGASQPGVQPRWSPVRFPRMAALQPLQALNKNSARVATFAVRPCGGRVERYTSSWSNKEAVLCMQKLRRLSKGVSCVTPGLPPRHTSSMQQLQQHPTPVVIKGSTASFPSTVSLQRKGDLHDAGGRGARREAALQVGGAACGASCCTSGRDASCSKSGIQRSTGASSGIYGPAVLGASC